MNLIGLRVFYWKPRALLYFGNLVPFRSFTDPLWILTLSISFIIFPSFPSSSSFRQSDCQHLPAASDFRIFNLSNTIMGGGILGLPHAMERMGLIPGTASWIWTSFPLLKNDRGESRHVMYIYIYIHESLSMMIYDYHWLSLSMMIYDYHWLSLSMMIYDYHWLSLSMMIYDYHWLSLSMMIYDYHWLSLSMMVYDYHWLSLSMMIYDILITFNDMLFGSLLLHKKSPRLCWSSLLASAAWPPRGSIFLTGRGGMLPEVLRDVTHLPVISNIDVIKQPFVDYVLKVFPWIFHIDVSLP